MNPTDLKILTLWNRGLTIPRIAARIGRPGQHECVREALRRSPEARASALERGVSLETEPITPAEET